MMDAMKQAIVNAAIMAGISALSIIIATQELTAGAVKAVLVTFGITFLTLLGRYFRPPKTDVNDEPLQAEAEPPRKRDGGMLLSALWV